MIESANTPRPVSAKRYMKNKFKRVPLELEPDAPETADASARGDLLEQWGLDDINADLNRCGFAGSPTKVHRIQSIVLKKEGSVSVEPTEGGIRGLVRELIDDRTLG